MSQTETTVELTAVTTEQRQASLDAGSRPSAVVPAGRRQLQRPGALAYSAAITIAVFLLATIVFNRVEKTFMDTV